MPRKAGVDPRMETMAPELRPAAGARNESETEAQVDGAEEGKKSLLLTILENALDG